MIRRRPFIIFLKSSFHQTLKEILRVEVAKHHLSFRHAQLPHTRYRRKKRSKFARKHHWLPLASFFSLWVLDYRWNATERRNELFHLLMLPAPASLRLHHGFDRVKRDNDIFHNFLNSNNLLSTFMPARYIELGISGTNLHSGFIYLRNFKMYLFYSKPRFMVTRDINAFEFNDDIREIFTTTTLAPAALYYCISEWIPLDYKLRFFSEIDFPIFSLFNVYAYCTITEIYKHFILLLLYKTNAKIVNIMISFKSVKGAGGSRKRVRLSLYPFRHWMFKLVSMRYKSKAGRNCVGRIVAYSKGAVNKFRIPNLVYNYNHHAGTACLVALRGMLHKSAMIGFYYTATNTQFYKQINSKIHLFEFSNSNLLYHILDEDVRMGFSNSMQMIRHLKHFAMICLFEEYPGHGILYARAAGSSGQILAQDPITNIAIVSLPSGARKFLSMACGAFVGRPFTPNNRPWHCGKAGFWRVRGAKPSVRGIAMNPVDHPNGGRSKSVRFPRTPWGKAARPH